MARPFRTPKPKARSTAEVAPPLEQDDQPVVVDDGLPRQRLHKLLATAGLGSRRDMEALIESGRVTINGQPAGVGASVSERDVVRVDGRPMRLSFDPELPQVLLYHKPEGEIVSQDDPEGRATVFDKLPRVRGAKWIAIGRLDINTSGLLIFTTSGELANRFMHPRYEVEREYAVRILGELSDEQMSQLTHGIELDDGPANFDSIYAEGGEGVNHWYKVIIKEGRNREVRRLFEAIHMPVSRLMRVRFGPINLPPRLKRAQMLKLQPKEIIGVLEWAGLPTPKAPIKQLSQREKDKLGTAYTPKARKSMLDRKSAREQQGEPRRNTGQTSMRRESVQNDEARSRRRITGEQGANTERKQYGKPETHGKAPQRPQRTRMGAPQQQKKSDRNRGRG